MNPILEALTGTASLTDQIIATDLLIATKSGVWNYAAALTETTSEEIRGVLRRQLEEAILAHEQVTKYMVARGWYHAYNPEVQMQLDLQNAETALSLQ